MTNSNRRSKSAAQRPGRPCPDPGLEYQGSCVALGQVGGRHRQIKALKGRPNSLGAA
jgi:hypothetical protein